MREITSEERRSDATLGRWAGRALVAGAIAIVVTMSLHPTSRDVLRAGNESEHVLARNAAVHWLALASLPLLVFGFLELSRRLSFRRPEVSLAFVIFSMGTVAVLCAAVASGLVATGVLRELLTADEAARPVLHALLGYTGRVNQAFARVYVFASSCAVILWSWAILRTRALSRSAGFLGLIVGAATLLAVGSWQLRLGVHGFGLVALGQSAWILVVGTLLFRSSKEHPPQATGGAEPARRRPVLSGPAPKLPMLAFEVSLVLWLIHQRRRHAAGSGTGSVLIC